MINMKRFTAFLLLPAGIVFLFSSCFLFRKAQTPPPVAQAAPPPPPLKKETLPPKKEAVIVPYNVPAFAKKIFKPVYEVALFTPLNIDQVVSDTGFSVSNRTPLPSATLSGLEFYEGALLALDSLQQDGIAVKLTVYDTKSTSKPLSGILSGSQLDSASLIIGDVNGQELKEIGHFAKEKRINFVSAIYPNDAGISDNPFLTILNSTLAIHCSAIQDFAQQKFGNKNILVVYQDNAQEKQNLEYMQQAYREMNYQFKSPLQSFEWGNNTTVNNLLPYLKKDKNNVIVITALYPQVALSIIGQLIPLTKTYTINIIGMPTLDGDQDLKKNEYYGINVYYSTPYPYYNASENDAIRSMMWQFFGKYRSRPSDMALKGYETLFYFGHLLHKEGAYFNANMNDPQGRIYTQFNIQPVYKNDTAGEAPAYFENMHLYFILVRDGKSFPGN